MSFVCYRCGAPRSAFQHIDAGRKAYERCTCGELGIKPAVDLKAPKPQPQTTGKRKR